MRFTKKSALVKTWVSLILMGVYTVEEVPNIFNLRAIVQEIVNETA